MRRLAQGLCVLAVLASGAARSQGTVPPWAQERAQRWSTYRTDARGQRIWQAVPFARMTQAEQWDQFMQHLKQGGESRRVALAFLGQQTVSVWAEEALKTRDPEVALALYRLGYRQPGADPFAYLGSPDRVERPWTHGLGLHLDRTGWRFQWIPSPALFTQSGTAGLPKGLGQAAQPGVLIHLKQLRPGLEKLVALSGGGSPDPRGVLQALAQGSRAGFAVRHLEPWLKQASPALEPLANREAWVLHYGTTRDGAGGIQGTLVFIPGDLPARTQLMMALLRLNPLSAGARTRVEKWTGPGASTEVQQLRGSGGVFHLIQMAEGTWISDREAPLRALLFPGPVPTLGERQEWTRVALSAMAADTELSFWLAPRIGADATFENQALRRRLANSQQGTWPNPFVAKAAPRTGAMAVALGAGPTEKLVEAILRVDDARDLPTPQYPVFTNGGQALTPEQRKGIKDADVRAEEALRQRTALRQDAAALQACLDLRGAALLWNGWVSAPPLGPKEKASLVELAKLRREDPWRAMQLQQEGKVSAFGGFGEPGMAPSLALAIPVQPARRVQAENLLKKVLPRLFQGQNQKQALGAAELHRILTAQAFRPAWTLVADTLVLGTDEAAVKAVAAGLLGQAPTLADTDSRAWARMEVDGARASAELENLLLAFLRSRTGSGWWIGEAGSQDESAAELAMSLGPFLGALKALGPVRLEWNWTAGGLEGRPR
ncbi:hypothetical protein GETHED_08250 [Geothrix edaphica]|uniref:DUF3352 domain-containing protein n=1 Tax=Geothrix edaphica TaxID=2927976 RepID=A0ABQ5PWN0_9BACT|nr:hypothetical protein GETHED_08250 [Geothrix edaphica]